MKYEKMGQIFRPEGLHSWMHHYAAPVTAVLRGDCIRVYFTTRGRVDGDGNYRTYITFLDCDLNDPRKILYVHDAPLLSSGPPGTFDEHGTMVAEVVLHEGCYYMYYMGWQRSAAVPYINQLGLALSKDGTCFEKVSVGPVIGINRYVPLGIGNVSIMFESGGFRMWYTHYLPWLETSKGYRPDYEIRYASSLNGLDWNFGQGCMLSGDGVESLATPCVRRFDGKYHMWFSCRPGVDASGQSGAYTIAYAESDDGLSWRRIRGKAGLPLSAEGWDSEMICYPDVLQTEDALFMFYCGNHFGREGFGCARLFPEADSMPDLSTEFDK